MVRLATLASRIEHGISKRRAGIARLALMGGCEDNREVGAGPEGRRLADSVLGISELEARKDICP